MTTRIIQLELDELDYIVVQEAIAKRQTFRTWPKAPDGAHAGHSNIAGLAVAEICRGWIGFLTFLEGNDGRRQS